MARQYGVYGKRSRAVYNPVDIFGSPQNLAPSPTEDTAVNHTLDDATTKPGTKIDQLTIASPPRRRRPLSERDGNAVPPIKSQRKPKPQEEVLKHDGKVLCVTPEQLYFKEGPEERVAGELDSDELDAIGGPTGEARDAEAVRPAPLASTALLHDADKASVSEDVAGEPKLVLSAITIPPVDMVPLVEPSDDIYSTHCAPLLELTAHDICCFTDWASQLAEHFLLSKIAEASFGEVYRLTLRPDLPFDSPTSTLRDQESVLKVIALKAPADTIPRAKREREKALKKAAAMSKPEDVASEVRLLQRMTSIPGYTNFRDVRVLSGRPGEPFINACKSYNADQKAAKKDMSIFPDPAKKGSYSDEQLWAVIEMQDAGTDLERLVERGECSDIWTIWDVFWQTVIALAKGEEAAEFEHRDLHLGNICVRESGPGGEATEVNVSKTLGFTGTEATLIDYTISRASLASSGDNGNEVAFMDLANEPHLFTGDSTDEYQYDIYRYMRNAVSSLSPTAPFPPQDTSSHTPWREFHPVTNLVWLHYVLYTLLEQIAWPSAGRPPAKKRMKEWKQWKRANDLEFVLLKCQGLLEPFSNGVNGISKAGDLVGLALEEEWLRDEDVIGAVSDHEVEDMAEQVVDAGDLAIRLGGLKIAGHSRHAAEDYLVPAQDHHIVAPDARRSRRKI
ncbi:hypothetical protein B0A48_17137 [Cryoendolithus antarcticus]|uniref:non-specific serine/threonine protein kinase n=1 Tax=Cryoendolithus antarcticus TaxID=1507870 RepID=A0A1V8SCA3_9PEZI|nr:hypothetical protein B0A48_17137 [Cryoendolithus antarcticus]